MIKSTIRDKTEESLKSILQLPSIKLEDHMVASDVKGWDSFSHIKIMIHLEHVFGIKFTLAELDSSQNMGELFMLIEKKIEKT